MADQFFGITNNGNGTVSMKSNSNDNNIEEQISKAIQNEISNTQNILKKIKEENPHSRLSDQQLRDLYDDFSGDGFVIF